VNHTEPVYIVKGKESFWSIKKNRRSFVLL